MKKIYKISLIAILGILTILVLGIWFLHSKGISIYPSIYFIDTIDFPYKYTESELAEFKQELNEVNKNIAQQESENNNPDLLAGNYYKKDYLESKIKGVHPSYESQFVNNQSNLGVILIHGYGGTPIIYEETFNTLNENKINVYNVRLQGHGTNFQDIANYNLENFYTDFLNAYKTIDLISEKTIVIGESSFGAYIATRSALDPKIDVEKVVLLSPFIEFKDKSNYLVPIAEKIIITFGFRFRTKSSVQKEIQGKALPIIHSRRYSYDQNYIGEHHLLIEVAHYMQENVTKLSQDLLVFYNTGDNTIDVEYGINTFEEMNNAHVEYLEGDHHIMFHSHFNPKIADEVNQKILDFILSD